MAFFSFSLSKDPFVYLSTKIKPNKKYYSKDIALSKELNNKNKKTFFVKVNYEKRINITNVGKKLLICLPPKFGLGDAIEYGIAINSLIQIKKFNKIGIAFTGDHHYLFEKFFSFVDIYPIIISQEKLSGNDQVYCSKCKEHRDHRKQVTLFRPPPVLIVHLKRFKYTNRHGQKIGRMVTCPLQGFDLSFAQPRQRREPIPVDLTMWEFLGGKYKDTPPRTIEESRGSIYSSGRPDHFPDPLYDCVAVVNHYGSFGGGHYVACAKNPVDHKWRLFDDAYVKVVDGASVISENAYIMFYVRRDMANVKVENLHSCASATEEQMKEYNKLLSTVQGAKNSALGKCFIS